MTELPNNWHKHNETLTRTIICRDFKHAVQLLNAISEIAETMQHHPDLTIKHYKELHISTTTHTKNRLTQKDYELARQINDTTGLTSFA